MRAVLVVAKKEFRSTFFSTRMYVIMAMLLFFTVISAYGLGYTVLNGIEIEGYQLLGDPNWVIVLLASLFYIFGSMSAIVLSFDIVSLERLENTLPLLLCRPISRRQLMLGKYLGVWAAMCLPILVLNAASLAILDHMFAGTYLTATAYAGYLLASCCLVGIFIALQACFSTLSKSAGTSILSGIGIWVFYVIFFPLLPALVANGMGVAPEMTSPQYLNIFDPIALGNPGYMYQLAVGVSVDRIRVLTIPYWAPAAALVVWLLGSVIVMLETFHRRAWR